MKVGILANPNKPRALELARRAHARLATGGEPIWEQETAHALGIADGSVPLESLVADALLAIGGDGTVLSALHRSRIPLLPVNAGTVGVLAEIDGESLPAFDRALDRLLGGFYFVEERMKIASELDGTMLSDATNEVVVHTAQVAKMRLFELSVDGKAVGSVRADGVIVATPTGSTSYALSALGPIVDPAIDAIVVTALAPFQASQRAVLIDPLRVLRVRLVLPEKPGVVVVDGRTEAEVRGGGAVVCYRSPRRASFVRFGSRFLHRLHGKKILPWSEEIADSEVAADADLPAPPAA